MRLALRRNHRPSPILTLVLPPLLAIAIAAGAATGPKATTLFADEVADPTWLADCQRYQLSQFSGRCPGPGNPQREDPWAPTIHIEQPPAELDCERVKLYIDRIFLLDCDGDGTPGGKVEPMLHVQNPGNPTGFFGSGSLVPDYGDEEHGDILPILECWDRDAMPSGISYVLDDPHFGEVYIASARVRAYCCDDC